EGLVHSAPSLTAVVSLPDARVAEKKGGPIYGDRERRRARRHDRGRSGGTPDAVGRRSHRAPALRSGARQAAPPPARRGVAPSGREARIEGHRQRRRRARARNARAAVLSERSRSAELDRSRRDRDQEAGARVCGIARVGGGLGDPSRGRITKPVLGLGQKYVDFCGRRSPRAMARRIVWLEVDGSRYAATASPERTASSACAASGTKRSASGGTEASR